MKFTPNLVLLLPIFLTSASPAASGGTGSITFVVGNVRTAGGIVHVDVCDQAHFLKEDCAWSGDAPAQLGVTSVTVRGLPPGHYAAQAFLDENRNGDVDRALFGIPKEGVGFSRDARIGFGPPKWADAAFAFDGTQSAQKLNLRYFLGAKGPPAGKH